MAAKEYPSIIFKKRSKSIKNRLTDYCKETMELYQKIKNLIDNYEETIVKECNDKSKELDIEGYEIEKECINFIAVEKPVASDLMYIESAIRVISHVKRIAYLCKNIADSSEAINKVNIPKELLEELKFMANYVQLMITNGFDSFINQDITTAADLEEDDDTVDQLFDKILNEVTGLLSKKTDYAINIMNVLFIARYLERIADRVVNIGDRVIYINTYERPHIKSLKEGSK
ncbi:phosphate uptake regulator PhoU [uncultured Methanobrevibacter sp.]|uniref:phosphate signaling complex PhoU family protein n=1 Tax=uncultured Methanobrevibacter sp. TaxID=253161 RepID=UPI0026DF6175|nr:phosphate uptake regulator PhoU [uncultured Methanobrevibacter sp.]